MNYVAGSGNRRTHLFLCGERPGVEELKHGLGFVGPAGDELWDRFSLYHLPGRDSWWVTNLVKTFSKDAPTDAEIRQWAAELRTELWKVKPLLIVTVGAHAARWFLGRDFDLRTQHGLLHTTRRAQTPEGAPSYVIPLVHSSAALRQPEMYQLPFTRDVQNVARFFKDGLHVFNPQPRRFLRTDLRHRGTDLQLRSFIRMAQGSVIGCDTEGTIEEPEAITFYVGEQGFLVGVDRRSLTIARVVLRDCKLCVLHYAVHDLQVLWRLGLDVPRLADSMLQAYVLNEFTQGLKSLAARHLNWQMSDYIDLVHPIDNAQCRATLKGYYAQTSQLIDRAFHRGAGTGNRRSGRKKSALTEDQKRAKRSLTSVAKILAKESAEKTIRQRWQASKFRDVCDLPAEPTWKDIPEEVGVPYAIDDAAGAHDLYMMQRGQIKMNDLDRCYRMDLAVLPMLARIETVGMQVDRDALSTVRDRIVAEYAEVCTKIESLLGYPLNPKASEDVSDALFGDLNLTPTQLVPSGKFYTTRDKYLEARKKEHLVVPLIIRGRELDKMRGSYTDRLPKLLSASGVYHPEWHYTRASTGRLTERIIILIPKHSDIGKLIRKCFVARTGNRLIANDLAQIELRVLAHLSGDKALTQIFREGRDPHTETARDLLGAPPKKEDQDESLHRLPSKKCNFGAFMGLSARGLTDQIRAGGNTNWSAGCSGCDDPRADHSATCDSVLFFREYFRKYPGIKQYINDRHAEARLTGYVRDLFGRRIACAGIASTGRGVVRRAERIAQATPVQATADGISKHWMKAIWRHIILPHRKLGAPYLEPWCRVHDDTILEASKYIARDVQRRVLACVPQLLSIPTTADGKIGKSWGEMH